MTSRVLFFIFGLSAYGISFVVTLYEIGFVGNLYVPKTIDAPGGEWTAKAILINILLLGVFGLQHSVMARKGFKERWTRIVPQPIERSMYVLGTSIVLALLMAFWQPIPLQVWSVTSTAAQNILVGLFWFGWLFMIGSTYMIDHFDLFGLRQVFLHLRGISYEPRPFTVRFLYKYIRQPIMLGFLIAFWATPTMTAGHLLFAAAMTVYILVGSYYEERDLMASFGETFRAYKQSVPMLVPFVKRKKQ